MRDPVDQGERGPQRLVALGERSDRTLQRVDVERPPQTRRCRHVVDGATALELVQEPKPLLGERGR